MELIFLCFFALIAGFIDAFAGGGGLIQLPAYFIFMPHFSTASLFGSNKFAGFSGTLVSTIQYLKKVKCEWRLFTPALIAAGIASIAGARLVSLFDKEKIVPVVVVLLVLIFIYTITNKNAGIKDERHSVSKSKTKKRLPFFGGFIGLYDGFFGPGAGSLMMFAFIRFLRFDFLSAAAHTKIMNLVTNLGALGFFIATGNVRYDVAVPVAICNVAGSYLGVKLAIRKGSALIRRIYILVVIALIMKLAWDYLMQ